MKKLAFVVVAFLALGTVLPACTGGEGGGGTTPENGTAAGTEQDAGGPILVQEKGVSIEFPAGWHRDPTKDSRIIARAWDHPDLQMAMFKQEGYPGHITFGGFDMMQDFELAELSETQISSYLFANDDSEELERGELEHEGRQWLWVVYKRAGPKSADGVREFQFLTKNGTWGYNLNLSCAKEDFEAYRPLAEAAARSARFEGE